MSLELFRNWMRTLYTKVYWTRVCTSIILCCLSMSSTLGMSSTCVERSSDEANALARGEEGGRGVSVLAQIWLGDGQPPNLSAFAASVKQKPKDLWRSEHHGSRQEQTPVKDGGKGAEEKGWTRFHVRLA